MFRPRLFAILAFFAVLLPTPFEVHAQNRLASTPDYHKYIDPLLDVKDFGIIYVDDGAADASILVPFHFDEATRNIQYDRPPDQVVALQALGEKMVPLLIDCLDDGRVTAARFNGSRGTKSMNVTVGYLCLDILTDDIQDKTISPLDCDRDGLGWCIHQGFYFRPDDFDCSDGHACTSRPLVSLVQRNWRWEYLRHRSQMRFSNRFDDWRGGTTNK